MKKKTRSQQDPAQTEQEKVCIFRHILLGACVLFTVLMLLLFIVLPDNSFSEMENRSLEGIPSFDRTDLLNGSFMKNAEKWARTGSAECTFVTAAILWKRRYSRMRSFCRGWFRILRFSVRTIRI